MKRIIYLGYYISKLDTSQFIKFLNYVSKTEGLNRIWLILDVIWSSLKYNISLLEYFQFHFYKLKDSERKKFAGTGYMYEYQLEMNPKDSRNLLDDKNLFNKVYKKFLVHNSFGISELRQHPEKAESLLNNASGKLVLKVSDGKCGAQVDIQETQNFSATSLHKYMKNNELDLAEEFIVQHDDIMRMSPSAVNTIRIFTQLDDHNEVVILGCRFRISINSNVDNLAAGNIAAAVEEKTGVVVGKGVYSDITKEPEEFHPVTGTHIIGFQIPFWKETLDLVKKAAKAHPQNRSIGWDVVITNNGPGLIEGNHDWCKLVWQLPVGKGLKPILEHFKKA